MTPFLSQIASHYFSQGNIGNNCFIFPSRRAIVFFKKYLSACVAASGKAVFAPECITINDFFFKLSGKTATDKVLLLVKLYDCYKSLNPGCEPLDEFIFWGDVLLADFDDTDKYLADPKALFTNISELKGMQDDFSYLSPTQEQALRELLSHFQTGGQVKEEFKRIWNLLLPLYEKFRATLSSEGLAYEGMVYRETAERMKAESAVDMLETAFGKGRRFIFAGLNALNECEKTVCAKMQDAEAAEFVWDYSGEMIRNPNNKSSFFLKDFSERFHQAFRTDDPSGLPRFEAISVPSAVGQAKMLPDILKSIAGPIDERTAIILPDEGLLLPVLNSIPSEIEKLNVTMGYPMNGSAIWSLFNDIFQLQLRTRLINGELNFYHKAVKAVLGSSILKCILGDALLSVEANVRKNGRYYIPASMFASNEVLKGIFRPAGSSPDQIEDYLLALIGTLASRIKPLPDMALELDFAKVLYISIENLKLLKLEVAPQTLFRLLEKLCAGASVPFQGEPLQGLQIMGPLETRALDFDNVIILSCNEGTFPRHSVSASFIPPELRKAFGLPTYEFQDAVWAYYFYRLIRRAGRVTMLYDSRTEGVKVGEESRYIRQLEMHFGVHIERKVASAPQISAAMLSDSIEKTDEHIAKLHKWHLSVSALQDYLSCQAKFYYGSVERMRRDEDIEEYLDAGEFGSVFHSVLETIYKDRTEVDAAYLQSFDESSLRGMLRTEMMAVLKSNEICGRNIIYEDIILNYLKKTLSRDVELLRTSGAKSFKMLGIEKDCTKFIGGYKFVGKIDRIDSLFPGTVRIVDYKTGSVSDNEAWIDDSNAEKVVKALFGSSSYGRPKIALQLYIYDLFARNMFDGVDIQNSIYSASRLFRHPVENCPACAKFEALMEPMLEELLNDISDTGKGWAKTKDARTCEYCDFKTICGR